ncbi:MFS transporter [Rossellomorea vietnamensis]|uniref:MFS transporter n=1 Tax=Rossellomorea vietnamensis TaxID=218284 RepID=A0A5D4NZ89_9BACI|nr:MFS transporter [Rossellomorea vietnamensis]
MEGMSLFQLLKNRSYRRLWSAQVISELGDGISHLLILFLASELTSNPMVFGYILIARHLPGMLFGTLVGPLVDRFSRKRMMIGADLYRFVIVLLMIAGQSSITLLLFLIFMQGIGAVFFEPAKSAVIPTIMRKDEIPAAVSLSQSTYMMMMIIAPSIGGFLLLIDHISLIFILDAATFLISALFLLRLKLDNREEEKSHQEAGISYLISLKQGLQSVTSNRFITGIFILLTSAVFVLSIVSANVYAIILNVFEVSQVHFGMMESLEGAFGILGALAVPLLMKKVSNKALIMYSFGFSGLLAAVVIPVYDLHTMVPLVSLYIWMSLIGAANPFINIPLNSMLMQGVPEELLGRISGILTTCFNGSLLGGLLLGGWLATLAGPLWTVTAGGLCLIAVSLIFPLSKFYGYLTVAVSTPENAERAG